MNKWLRWWLWLGVWGLLACDSRLQQTQDNVARIDQQMQSQVATATTDVKAVTAEPIARGEGGRINRLSDPFRVRDFALPTEQLPTLELETKVVDSCQPPQCVPPSRAQGQEKQPLEYYELAQLRWVGVMLGVRKIALIKTPDNGVVMATIGDYIGRHYGEIVAIDAQTITIQEKRRQGGQWHNQRRILTLGGQ